MSDTLNPGQSLLANGRLVSKNGVYTLIMQTDGNAVLYPKDRGPIWDSGTVGRGFKFIMQTDGNLVVYTRGNAPIWATDTNGRPGARLVIQDDGNLVVYQGSQALWSTDTVGGRKKTKSGPGKWLANAASVAGRSLTHALAEGVKSAGDLAGKVPIVGSPIHSALNIAAGPFALADAIAHGARVDKALLTTVKSQVSAVREIAPYAKLLVTSMPGLGSGIGAAIAMGTAIANGAPLSEIATSAIAGAVPGGAIGAAVFQYTQKVVSGENVVKAGINVGISQLPPVAQKGLDVLQRVAKGENIPKLAVDEARKEVEKALPPGAMTAVNLGIAVGTGKNLQKSVEQGIANIGKTELAKISKQGEALVQATPLFRETVSLVANVQQSQGFHVGAQVLSYTGVNERTITTFRNKLSKEQKIGFDLAISARVGKVRSRPAPKGLPPKAMAGFYTTKGMSGGGPKMNTAQMKLIAKNKEARKGAAIAIKEMPRRGLWQVIKEFVGLA